MAREKRFYGIYKAGGQYVLDLVGYTPGAGNGEMNPRTGRPTNFQSLEIVDRFDFYEVAEREMRRLNTELASEVQP